MIDLYVEKCFNSYVKVKKELEVSSQSFNSNYDYRHRYTRGHPPELEQGSQNRARDDLVVVVGKATSGPDPPASEYTDSPG